MLELEGRRFVQASYTEDGWIRNPRAAGQATMTDHGRPIAVKAVELPLDNAAPIIRRWSIHALCTIPREGRYPFSTTPRSERTPR